MKLSRIQFSLAVSLLLHGLAVGGVVFFVRVRNVESIATKSSVPTIELIAAEPPPEPPSTEAAEKSAVKGLLKPSPAPPLDTVKPPEQGTYSEPQTEIQPVLQEIIQPAVPVAQLPTEIVSADEPLKQISPAFTAPVVDLNAAGSSDEISIQAFAMDETNPEPEYPLAARRRHQQGLVILSVTVGADGRAAKVAIKESSGYPLLDASAEKHSRERRYSPARMGKNAVESEIEVPIRFKLKD